MRIEWLTVCREVERDGLGDDTLRGVLVDTSVIGFLGRPITLTVALVVAESYVNLRRGVVWHPLSWRVLGPDMSEIVAIEEQVPLAIDQGQESPYPSGWDGRLVLSVDVIFTPESEGAHLIEFRTEGGAPEVLTHLVELENGE